MRGTVRAARFVTADRGRAHGALPRADTSPRGSKGQDGQHGEDQQSSPSLRDSNSRQRRALGVAVAVGVLAIAWLARPVGTGLVLGGFLAFSLQPFYERLRARHGAAPAALLCSLGSCSLIAAAVVSVGYLFVSRGLAMVGDLPAELAEGGVLRGAVVRGERWLTPLHVETAALVGRLTSSAVSFGASAASFTASLVGGTLHAMLSLFFMGITTYFVLRRWETLTRRAEVVLPLHPHHTRAVLHQLREVGRHVFVGTMAIAFGQGALAALGFWIFGLPQWAFFGIVTGGAALVPGIGTALVWVPAGVYLVGTGHTSSGLLSMLWGAIVVVGIPDYVVRPHLVGSEDGTVPTVLTFVAVFGGVEVFGLIGLVLGPVVVAVAVALLRTYHDEMLAERAHELDDAPSTTQADTQKPAPRTPSSDASMMSRVP